MGGQQQVRKESFSVFLKLRKKTAWFTGPLASRPRHRTVMGVVNSRLVIFPQLDFDMTGNAPEAIGLAATLTESFLL